MSNARSMCSVRRGSGGAGRGWGKRWGGVGGVGWVKWGGSTGGIQHVFMQLAVQMEAGISEAA